MTENSENRTPPPPLTERPRGRAAMAKADLATSVVSALAIGFAASALYHGPTLDEPSGFVWIAPAAAVLYLIALIGMFLDRERHGLARALHSVGAAVLAIAALMFTGKVPAHRVLFAYWVPAVLGLCVAIGLAQGHRLARQLSQRSASGTR